MSPPTSSELPLPRRDADEGPSSFEDLASHVRERRGMYLLAGFLLIVGVVAILIVQNLGASGAATRFPALWERCQAIEARQDRDLSAADEIGQLQAFVATLEDRRLQGYGAWFLGIYSYREAYTSDKQTSADRRAWLEKSVAALQKLGSAEFEDADLLIDKPGWFTLSGPAPSTALLDQVQKDLTWWNEHEYVHPKPAADPVVVLRTDLGDVHLQFFAEQARERADLFVSLVQKGTYNGTAFHFVRGGSASPQGVVAGDPYSFFYNDPLKPEQILRWGKGTLGRDIAPQPSRLSINHLRGVVTSQRLPDADWDNAVQFQVLLHSDPTLDRIASPFATVVEGMDVIEKIARSKTAAAHKEYKDDFSFSQAATRDLLVEPVWIRKAIAYRGGKALEHAFPLADGEKQLATLRDTPILVLKGDDLYAGRLLRDPKDEGEPRIGLDFPYPEDVSGDKRDPRGQRD